MQVRSRKSQVADLFIFNRSYPAMIARALQKHQKTSKSGFFIKFPTKLSMNRGEIGLWTLNFFGDHLFFNLFWKNIMRMFFIWRSSFFPTVFSKLLSEDLFFFFFFVGLSPHYLQI